MQNTRPVSASDGQNRLKDNAFLQFDRVVQGGVAEITGGRPPLQSLEAWADWWFNMALSPGKQTDLCLRAAEAGARLALGWRQADGNRQADLPYATALDVHSACLDWWKQAVSGVHGMSDRHRQTVAAQVGDVFQAISPENSLWLNPELRQTTIESGGLNLVQGAGRLFRDTVGKKIVDTTYTVGKNVAVTPGRVVFRNRLIELIQYEPTTPRVRPEPILIVPAWIMKYYILDLRPENSLIKYLVDQGHTVFTISWLNPTAVDADMGMEDYRRLGVMAAIDAIGDVVPGRQIHAAGYCLGGTMLSIAAATMARNGDHRLASMTLFAAQTDFTEPGDLKLFIGDSDLDWLDSLMDRHGGLDGARMGGAFQILRQEDLIWKPFLHHYVLGEQDKPNDLMAWNADVTRMPCRMHSEYLRSLFLRNDLAGGRFTVDGQPIALRDIRVPIFALGTAKDHVAPWRSVYKITLSARSDITFALASGGHNAGVVSEPGHRGRSYRVLAMPASGAYVGPDAYLSRAAACEGSWWPEWQRWLAGHSGAVAEPPAMAPGLCDAPGTYVLGS